jgi:hypothetical protein
MTFVPTVSAARDILILQPSERDHRGFWRRLFEAVAASRKRQADHEIASYLAGAGRLTDQAEREIERRFLSNPARW